MELTTATIAQSWSRFASAPVLHFFASVPESICCPECTSPSPSPPAAGEVPVLGTPPNWENRK